RPRELADALGGAGRSLNGGRDPGGDGDRHCGCRRESETFPEHWLSPSWSVDVAEVAPGDSRTAPKKLKSVSRVRSWDAEIRGRSCDADAMGDAELHILGPIAVVAGGQTRRLGGPRQRALLAALALHANEVVSVERILDSVWGASEPPSAR